MAQRPKATQTKKSPTKKSTAAKAIKPLPPQKADVELVVRRGNDFMMAIVSVISADSGKPLSLARTNFKAMAVQEPANWSASHGLSVSSVNHPTPGIHVFSLTGFSKVVPDGHYTIAVAVTGSWQGQAIAVAV